MKYLIRLLGVAIVLAGFVFAGSLMAQTSQPAAVPAAKPSEIRKTRDGRPLARDVRQACKTEAAGKGLSKGDVYRLSMKECIGKQRPDLVKAYECRQEARTKKIEAADRKQYLKDCRARA